MATRKRRSASLSSRQPQLHASQQQRLDFLWKRSRLTDDKRNTEAEVSRSEISDLSISKERGSSRRSRCTAITTLSTSASDSAHSESGSSESSRSQTQQATGKFTTMLNGQKPCVRTAVRVYRRLWKGWGLFHGTERNTGQVIYETDNDNYC